MKITEKWENILSPTTEEAMLKILGNPTTGPFGNPIPYSNYKEVPMKNLLDVDPNEDYEILKISEELKKDNNYLTGEYAEINLNTGISKLLPYPSNKAVNKNRVKAIIKTDE